MTARGVPVFMNAIDYNYLCQELASGGWQAMEQIFLSEGFPREEIEKQKKGNQARLYSPQHPFPATTVQDNDVLTLGDVSLRCIHTPGHTPGHTCLYIEEKEILFSGDHILFDITPNISVWRNVPFSLADYLESLQKIKYLKVSHTFPGHREFQGDIQDRIDALTLHHHARLKEILDAIDHHPDCTAYETAGRISWSARGRAWEDFHRIRNGLPWWKHWHIQVALRQRRHKQHQTSVSEHAKYSKCPGKRNSRKPLSGSLPFF